MNLVDSYIFLSAIYINFYVTVAADWKIELGNLVVLWVVRIEIVLTVKLAVLSDCAVCCKTYCCRIFHNLLIEYRKRTWHSGTYRTCMCIWRTAESCAASTENLCSCGKFYMNFETNDGFILFTPSIFPPFRSDSSL